MIKWENNATTTIVDVGGIDSDDTELTVDTGDGDLFPVVASPNYFKVTLVDDEGNKEIVKVTARADGSDTFTISRAQEGTSAQAFDQGSAVELAITAGSLDMFSKGSAGTEHIYVVDSSETDQGAAGDGGSFKDLLTDIGTSEKAIVIFPHDSSGNTTTFTFSTNLDASTYTNILIIFMPGVVISYDGATVTWPEAGYVVENGNNYDWDAENTKWRVVSGNRYATVDLPTSPTYTIDTGTVVTDTTVGKQLMWNGSSWTEAEADTESLAFFMAIAF